MLPQRYLNTFAGLLLSGLGVLAQKWGIDATASNGLIIAGVALCGTGYSPGPSTTSTNTNSTNNPTP
jgi:hypothetical protein